MKAKLEKELSIDEELVILRKRLDDLIEELICLQHGEKGSSTREEYEIRQSKK